MSGLAGLGRRGLLAFGAATVLTACTSTAESADSDTVRTDPRPLERRFTALGPLFDVHWLGIVLGTDSRMSVPGPTDVRVVGTARLRAGAVATIVRRPPRDFQFQTPRRIPAPLVEFLPKDARWIRSASFDDEVTGKAYTGAFSLDPGKDRVYFDTTNPRTATSPEP